jgi:enoyl-CoA hydratase
MLTALTGEPITAEHAERHGLIAVLAQPDQALAATRDNRGEDRCGPLAVKVMKKIFGRQTNWVNLSARSAIS